jgi:hypothetical protein
MAAGQTLTIEVVTQHAKAVTGLNQVQKATAGVSSSVKSATAEMKRHASQYNSTAVATNKFAKGALQQAGYQVGDFVVQIQNGTNAMQAFGQQGAQMAGVFGPVGAVIGAGIAIFSSVAIAIQKSTGAAIDFNKALDDSSSAIDSYLTMVASLSDAHGTLVQSLRQANEANSSVIEDLIAIERNKAFESILKLRDAMYGMVAPSGFFNVSLNENVTQLLGIGNASADARRRINEVAQSFIDLRNAGDLESQYAAATKLLAQFKAIAPPVGEMSDEQLEFYYNLTQSIQRMELLGAAANITAQNVKNIADKANEIVAPIDEVARNYVDILGSEKGLAQATTALNKMFEARLGTIDDTANKYVDIIGSEQGLAAAVAATNALYLARQGTIDDTANNYVDVLGSEEGLRKSTEALNELYAKGLEDASKAAKVAGNSIENDLTPEMKRAIEVGDMVGSSIESAMMGAVRGTMSVKDAFRSMAVDIIAELYRIFVVKQITGFISGAITGAMGGSPVPAAPMPRPSFAGGGYTGDGARSGGLDGKGGFMAMLHPRETVVDHTQGQGTGGVVINQTINVSTGVQQTVRSEIKSLMPQIAESAKAAVVDAKRRGGSYGRSFA